MNTLATGIASTAVDAVITAPQNLITLSSSAVIIRPEISCWTAEKADRGLAAKMSADAGAVETVMKAAHELFKRDPELTAISNVRQSVYNYMAREGVSYEYDGGHLTPQFNIEGTLDALKKLQADFYQKVNTFVDGDADRGIPDYDAKVSAQAFVRGDMFRREHYRSKEYVRSRFNFSWTVSAIREDDFRNTLFTDLANDIVTHNRRQYSRMVDEVGQKLRDQIAGLMQSLSHTCAMEETVSDEGEVKVRFRRLHASTVQKTLDFAKMIQSFNPTGDEVLDKACSALRQTLGRYEGDRVEALRESETAREEVKEQVDDLLKMFGA